MRFEDVFVAATGRWLPPAEPSAGGITSVTVSQGESAPEMAALAAGQALSRMDAAVGVDLLLHADVYYQGHDLWAPASFILRRTGLPDCPAVEVRQLSNGGMAALGLAATHLLGEGTAVLVTAADRFCPPGFDRWRSDPGTVYADGGAALVLARGGGFARLRCLVTESDPGLEAMHRGDDPFGVAPFSVRGRVDLDACKRAFLAGSDISGTVARVAGRQHAAVKRALAEAEVTLAEIDWFVLPHFGRRRLVQTFLRPFAIDVERTTWPWGRGVGHLGAGDQLAGLDHLASAGLLRPGQRCLLAGVGAGFTWSCAVVEVVSTPEYAEVAGA
ncbi:3-oxoacyl-ACP synthase [Amycolatopsis acidicola]|uniref:3-oxoacyl-ACP synthase n=1 Tax=Amycolatopsis acidicola TaxID=2596893 RepID=A0A5N0VJX7_9PSEU|nr:ketoacyl-ACP synthase III family protein [Amycolatopsis acidicola]KAA9166505.1 3-oxoacyl-ACP synthase [Amycolatopsis acidicola]